DGLLRHNDAVSSRAGYDAAAREPLADIIVGIAFELESDAAREPGAKTLTGRSGEFHVYGAVGQPGMPVALGRLSREHRAHRAIGVLDRALDAHGCGVSERSPRLRDQSAVEDVVNLMVLRLTVVNRNPTWRFRLEEQTREVEPAGFPV